MHRHHDPVRPRRRPGRWRRTATVIFAAAGLAPAGCNGWFRGGDRSLADAQSPGAALISSLIYNDHGLAVRQWTILDRPGVVASVLRTHDAGGVLDPETERRLQRNGLRVIAVRTDELDSLAAALGGPSIDVNAWYGQVIEWRELVSRVVSEPGKAIAIDGRVRGYRSGRFRLMCRCWTVQTEDGPCMHLEMIPQYEHTSANSFLRLLGETRDAPEPFPSLSLDLVLHAGLAYVITSASPDESWPIGAETGRDVEWGGPPAAASSRTGADLGAGPAALGPPTLGEWLLGVERQPPSRSMLILVPRIPSELWPDAD